METEIYFGENKGVVTHDKGDYIGFIDTSLLPYIIHRSQVRTSYEGINPVFFTISDPIEDNQRYDNDINVIRSYLSGSRW